jgi:hypothetical protein
MEQDRGGRGMRDMGTGAGPFGGFSGGVNGFGSLRSFAGLGTAPNRDRRGMGGMGTRNDWSELR